MGEVGSDEFAPQGTLAISADIFTCHNLGWAGKGCYWHLARASTKSPGMHQKKYPQQAYFASNASGAKVETPWCITVSVWVCYKYGCSKCWAVCPFINMYTFLLNKHLGMEFLGHRICLCPAFVGIASFLQLYQITPPAAVHEHLGCSPSAPRFGIFCHLLIYLFIFIHLHLPLI